MVSSDALFSRVAKTKLENWGYAPHLVGDAEAALRWHQVNSCRLAIVDFDLAEGAGQKLCADLRAAGHPGYIYLLCFGGATDKESVIRALESGADSYIPKPLHPGELKLRLRHAERLLSLDDAIAVREDVDQPNGLLSRSAFERFYGIIHAQCRRNGGTGVLIFTEIADIGAFRDRHGPAAVDAVDQAVARHIASVPRGSDVAARLEPGRFCLLLSNTTSDQCPALASRLAKAFEDFFIDFENHRLRLRLSLSMVDFPAASVSLNEAMAAAPGNPLAKIGWSPDLANGVPAAI